MKPKNDLTQPSVCVQKRKETFYGPKHIGIKKKLPIISAREQAFYDFFSLSYRERLQT